MERNVNKRAFTIRSDHFVVINYNGGWLGCTVIKDKHDVKSWRKKHSVATHKEPKKTSNTHTHTLKIIPSLKSAGR